MKLVLFAMKKTLALSLITFFSLCSNAFGVTDNEEVFLAPYSSHLEGVETFQETHEIESALPVFGETLELPLSIENAFKALPIVSKSYLKRFSHITQNLHAVVEQETDLFYFVNTSQGQSAQMLSGQPFFVPSQHLVILRRIQRSRPVFLRGLDGQMNGLNIENIEIATLSLDERGRIDFKATPQFRPLHQSSQSGTPFIPVSTGVPGDGGIRTFSGIFRINERRSNERRSNIALSAPMQYSVYINAEYNGGTESGVAAHGTPPGNWHLLGKSAASHGCVRLQSDFSKWNRDVLFTQNRPGGTLIPRPEYTGPVKLWNRREHYPPPGDVFQSLPEGQKIRALFITFEGFDGLSTSI